MGIERMDVNALLWWTFILTVCAFVLFVQTLLVIRTVLLARLALLRYGVVIIVPLAMSIWGFIVSLGGYQSLSLLPPSGIHITPAVYAAYQSAIAQAVTHCQIMTALIVLFIIALALFERKALPTNERSPLWVAMRERRFTR